jgi:uncharacterized protein YdiU (UPF0061 family)
MIAQDDAIDLVRFDNSYARLPDRFFVRLAPTPVAQPRLIRVNETLARQLGFDPDELGAPEGVEFLAGNRLARGAEPLAMAYAGHQFGSFVPQLGDGRAILLGEVMGRDGIRRDIQLKGAGPTPFSRRGDGRAALGPVLREYLVSEAMAVLGIPTTRALAAVTTGETVWRDMPLPGAIFVRVASSHIRVGTFQFFAARGDTDAVRRLADYVIARHYPDARNAGNPYRALLDSVIARQAELVARWLLVGFIHGVMNTDNMSIAGETIDYGPCAFMDAYHPSMVYSSIDERGRYAYGNQPAIAQWNLARLAEALLPLLAAEKNSAVELAQDALGAFAGRFEAAYSAGLSRKLGLFHAQPGDLALAQNLLDHMAANGADFTVTFRCLAHAAADSAADAQVRALFSDADGYDAWAAQWRARLAEDGGDTEARCVMMRANNPAYIPRNHLVEEAISAAVTHDDFTVFEKLLAVITAPYDEKPGLERYAAPPRPDQIVRQTFCGT